jgi:hypothetical protein
MHTDEYQAGFGHSPAVSRETETCGIRMSNGAAALREPRDLEAAAKLAGYDPKNLTEEGNRISELCAAAGLDLVQPIGFTFTVGGPECSAGVVLALSVPSSERLRSILRDYTETAVDAHLGSA